MQRATRWTIFLSATALVVYLCLRVLSPFLNVIAWSAVLSIAFHPVHERFVRQTGRVGLSAFMTSVLVVVAILIPLLFMVALAITQFLALRDYLQVTFQGGFDVAAIEPLRRAWDWVTGLLGIEAPEIVAWIGQHANELGRLTAGYSLTIAANVSGLVVSFVFVIFAMFLLLRDGQRIVAGIPDVLPFERTQSEAILLRIRDVIYASVYGVLVVAGVQGVLCALMFWILGIPSAVLWGVVTALTSALPLVGAAAVWVPGAAYLALIGEWPRAVVLAVWGTLVISGVDNFLRPRLVGGRVGLSELAIFFAILGGLQAFGLLGIILGPVLFAIVASILDVLRNSEAPPVDLTPGT